MGSCDAKGKQKRVEKGKQDKKKGEKTRLGVVLFLEDRGKS